MDSLESLLRRDFGTAEGDGALVDNGGLDRYARRTGLPRSAVAAGLLERGFVPERYSRNMGTLKPEGQLRLLRSRVAVIGCGGLGGSVVELAARAGIGSLVLVDGDRFAESNLNRQLLCTEAQLGRPKATAARERVEALNSMVAAEAHVTWLSEDNAPGLLAGCHAAVDCLDSNSARRILFAAAAGAGIPVVHGAIGGFHGQVAVIAPGGPTPIDHVPQSDGGAEQFLGTPSSTPAVIGALQAAALLKLLAGYGTLQRGTLHWIDMEGETAFSVPL
ncbi:MAG: HesA/MoeB/ThiF family protein [Synergistales bacterium]|nr:HesA/MoeB/ThiF family protein [Synergistales bacterium]